MQWLGLHWADWLLLLAYLIGVTALGVWSHRRVRNMVDYFMGGRRFGKLFLVFFAFGAGTSSDQAISVVAGTWRAGLPGIWWQFLWLWSTPFYWMVAPIIRRMRAITTSDFFEARFDTSTATLYSAFGITISITIIASGLYGSGKMVNALTGGELQAVAERLAIQVPEFHWDPEAHRVVTGWRTMQGYEFAILAMTVLFVLYGMAGGLGAAILTDMIQGILTIVFSFLLLPFVFHQIGGFGALHTYEIPGKDDMFSLFASGEVARRLGREPLDAFYVFMLSITALAGIVVQPHIMGVCGSGRTELDGRVGFCYGNFLKRFCTIAWTFTALACIVWYLHPELSPLPVESRQRLTPDVAEAEPGKVPFDEAYDRAFADELFGRAAAELLPAIAPGLVGLLLASLLAAVMSTCDAQMITASGLFTENIYRRFFVRGRSQRHYLWVGRIAGLVIVLLALVLQATFSDVIDALKVVLKWPAAIGISWWVGVVWKRWTPAAVWVSTLTTIGVWAGLVYFPDLWGFLPEFMFSGPQKIADKWQMFLYMTAGLGAGLVTSWLTRPVPQEKLERFFLLLRTPVRAGERVPGPCMLPEDPERPQPLLVDRFGLQVPRFTWLDLGGFAVAWVFVAFLVWLTWWLARVL